jgi:hypothetical protein
MGRRFNGGVRGKLPTVSTSSASGMWDLLSAHAEKGASNWPSVTLPTVFSVIFGSATSFTIQTDNAWAVPYSIYSSYSSAYGANANAFWSYISTATTAPNAGTSNWYEQNSVPALQQTSTLSSPSVTQSAGYTTSESVNWSTPTDGVWMGGNTSVSVITANISSSNFTSAKYFMYRGYGSNYSYHNPYVIKITANGISRLFATQNLNGRTNPTSAVYVAYFAPLNSTFTSFTDSRLTSAGSTLDPSYFEWI